MPHAQDIINEYESKYKKNMTLASKVTTLNSSKILSFKHMMEFLMIIPQKKSNVCNFRKITNTIKKILIILKKVFQDWNHLFKEFLKVPR